MLWCLNSINVDAAELISSSHITSNGSTSTYSLGLSSYDSVSYTLPFIHLLTDASTSTQIAVPEGADACYIRTSFFCVSDGVAPTTSSFSWSGQTSYNSAMTNGQFYRGFWDYAIMVPSLSVPYIALHDMAVTYTFLPSSSKISFSMMSNNGVFVYFYNTSGGQNPVTKEDIEKLGEQITTGFDSSAGDQVADQLGQEMDNYLQTEDVLYDQMQYDVPEITLADDTQGILLASNFLQSLYVSNDFIAQVITYALTFGLILFIIGFLKKRGSG